MLYRFRSTFASICVGCIGLFLLCRLATAAVTSADEPDSPSENPEVLAAGNSPAPVRLGGRELFVITNGLGPLTAAQRARSIEQRLSSVANATAVPLNALRVVELNHVSEIFLGDALIRTVTDEDAAISGKSRQQLAGQQLESIRSALEKEFRDRDMSHVLRAALLSTMATVILAALLFSLRRLYVWTHSRLNRAAAGWRWKSPLERLKLLGPEAMTKASRSVSKLLAWVIGVSATYAYLEYVLSLFPWTQSFAAQMSEASRAAILRVLTGLLNYVPNLINIVVIVAVARFMLAMLRRVFEQVALERFGISGFHPEWAMPTYSLVRFFVIAVAAVMMFPYLPGSGSEGFRGVSAFVGLMVSFGAAPAIANLIAGIIITYMRPFKVTDRVRIADATGDILGKDLLVVRMRTIKNVDITIPNSLVLANHIINFSSSAKTQGLILNTTITIGYDAPWVQVHALLIEAAKRLEGVLKDPSPFVLQTTLDDSYVAYEINAYTDRPNEMAVLYSHLNESIQDVFNAAGVEILSPHYAAVRDGNRMAVPDTYLPKDYRAPGFTVLSRILRPGRSE